MRWRIGLLGALFVVSVPAMGQFFYDAMRLDLGAAFQITNRGVVAGGSAIFDGQGYPQLPPFFGAKTVADAPDGSFWASELTDRFNSAVGARESLKIWFDNPGVSTAWRLGGNSRDINSRGEVVGDANRTNPDQQAGAFIFADFGDGWGAHPLPPLDGAYRLGTVDSGARAINDKSQVVGALPAADGINHAFLFDRGVMQDLGQGIAVDINNRGQVLIINNGSGFPTSARIYDSASSKTTQLGSYGTYKANAINEWGQVVATGYAFGGTPALRPLLWDGGEFYEVLDYIKDPTVSIEFATSINDRGQIAGYNYTTNTGHAYVLTPDPGSSAFFPETSSQLDLSQAKATFVDAPTERWYALMMRRASASEASGPVAAGTPGGDSPNLDTKPGYHYTAKGDSRFAAINQFPLGFTKPFRVSVGDVVLGEFTPNQGVNFTTYAGILGDSFSAGGVREFTITGIQPTPEFAEFLSFSVNIRFVGEVGDFELQARNNLLGDADGDDHVGFADFVLLRDAYGRNGVSWFDGDFDLNGRVDAVDFDIYAPRIDQALTDSQIAEISAFAASVPEPHFLPAGAAILLLLNRRRRPDRGLGARSDAQRHHDAHRDQSRDTGGDVTQRQGTLDREEKFLHRLFVLVFEQRGMRTRFDFILHG